MTDDPRKQGSAHPLSADELEQRRSADGALEDVADGSPVADGPIDADVLEQRQRVDGGFEDASSFGDVPDRPLSPDELEQRQVVELDEDERRDG